MRERDRGSACVYVRERERDRKSVSARERECPERTDVVVPHRDPQLMHHTPVTFNQGPPAIERAWHAYDSHSQILALLSGKSSPTLQLVLTLTITKGFGVWGTCW